jgi:hypothetical protein
MNIATVNNSIKNIPGYSVLSGYIAADIVENLSCTANMQSVQ